MEISKRIAKTLKSLRQERGWSLDKTAFREINKNF